MVAPPVAPTATSLVMNRSALGALRSGRSARTEGLFPRPVKAPRERDRPRGIADESCPARATRTARGSIQEARGRDGIKHRSPIAGADQGRRSRIAWAGRGGSGGDSRANRSALVAWTRTWSRRARIRSGAPSPRRPSGFRTCVSVFPPSRRDLSRPLCAWRTLACARSRAYITGAGKRQRRSRWI